MRSSSTVKSTAAKCAKASTTAAPEPAPSRYTTLAVPLAIVTFAPDP